MGRHYDRMKPTQDVTARISALTARREALTERHTRTMSELSEREHLAPKPPRENLSNSAPAHPGAGAVQGQARGGQVALVRGEHPDPNSRATLLALDFATVEAMHPESSEGRKGQPDGPAVLTAEAGAEDAPSLTLSPGTGAAVPSATAESPAAARVDVTDLASTPGVLSELGADASSIPTAAGSPSSGGQPSNVLQFKTKAQIKAERAERRRQRAADEERAAQARAEALAVEREKWAEKRRREDEESARWRAERGFDADVDGSTCVVLEFRPPPPPAGPLDGLEVRR